MNCLLYRLRFNTPVHFGSPDSALSLYSAEDHFRADTLFSALCHTALQLHGEEGVLRLIDMAKEGALLLSDAMPWKGQTLYLPKPYCTAKVRKEQPADQRKKLKKLNWIPVDRFDDYCSALRTGELFTCEAPSFGQSYEMEKAVVPDGQDAVPYCVGVYQFREDAGLYFLASCDREEDQRWLTGLITALGLGGIGGRVSSGYGKFTVVSAADLAVSGDAQHRWIRDAVRKTDGTQLLLTTSLPVEEELEAALERASFQMVRRAGFIASGSAVDPRKKQTQYFLDAGSVFAQRFRGDVYSVAVRGKHEIFRYSKPLFLGVAL